MNKKTLDELIKESIKLPKTDPTFDRCVQKLEPNVSVGYCIYYGKEHCEKICYYAESRDSKK